MEKDLIVTLANRDFNLEINFWDLNPQLTIMTPFSKLYKRDRSQYKTKSSNEMWCIVLYSDPIKSKLYRLEKEERKKDIEDNFYKVDWNDKIIQEVIEAYPHKILSNKERNFKNWEDKMRERDNFLIAQPYDLDNGDKLDKLLANSDKLWKSYKIAEEEMLLEQAKQHGKGNRKLTAFEKGEF